MARGFRRCLAGPVLLPPDLGHDWRAPCRRGIDRGDPTADRKSSAVTTPRRANSRGWPRSASTPIPATTTHSSAAARSIAPLWILTASHCVIGDYSIDEDEHGHETVTVEVMPAHDLDVIVGKTDLLSPGGERHRAAEIVLHPAASLRLIGEDMLVPVNDLALVRLRTPTTVTPVPLARAGQQALYAPHVSA